MLVNDSAENKSKWKAFVLLYEWISVMIMMKVVYIPFNLYKLTGMMEGLSWEALCNEAPFSHELNSALNEIRVWDLLIQTTRPPDTSFQFVIKL